MNLKQSRPAAKVEAELAAATQHLRAGRSRQAMDMLGHVLDAQPDHPVALHLLGIVMQQAGKGERAAELIGKAIAHEPDYTEAHNSLGNVLAARGRFEEAAASYERTIALDPAFAEAHGNLGNMHLKRGNLEAAIACCREALALTPGLAEVHNSLGLALHSQGESDEAVASIERALALNPGYAEAHNNLGNVLAELGKHEEAAFSFQMSISLKPDYTEAHSNLGIALRHLDKFEEAGAACRRAIALDPNHAEAHVNLGTVLAAQARLEEAVASYRTAMALDPGLSKAHGAQLVCMHYDPRLTIEEIFAEHRRWNAQHAAPLAREIRRHANDRDPDRTIRVGFVSGSFRRHPVGYMITPAIEARNEAVWELYVYSNGGAPDDLTERIRAAADVWRDVGRMRQGTIARVVREDEIDILIDLSGHGDGNLLAVFARKPAPVQAKWVGCQINTTGMDAMDYFISDAVETPPGAEKWFTEEVIRLPDGYACFEPPAYAPEVGPPPVRRNGHVTFGCFNKLAKVTGEVVALWTRLLHRLPEARLVLKTRSLNDGTIRERYRAMFEGHGIGRERVDLVSSSPHAELLAHYNEIDIALDTFPYSGCLTTYEALWMGVPVVTLAGETFAGRHSASHLHNVGLDDWVVETPDDYLAVAEHWGRDLDALADLRAGLRDRMAASPLCDGPRFARNLEAAFRAMWRRWCDEPPRQRDP